MAKPPYWPTLILNWICSSKFLEEIEGDLLEYYERDLQYTNKWVAQYRYTLNAIKFMNSSNFKERNSSATRARPMLLSSIKTGYRNALRNGFYSLLNLSGLIIGITSFLFVAAYLLDELSYDRYQSDADRIYRITDGVKFDDDFSPGAIVPSGWADGFGSGIPEIEEVGRIHQAARFNPTIKFENKIFSETGFIFIDSTLLNIFQYNFTYKKSGNPLSYPNSIILTDRMAEKYFGATNPLDKTLVVNGNQNYIVSGVIQMPGNNSFKFDFAALFIPPKEDRMWNHTFVRLTPQTDVKELERKLEEFTKETYGDRPYAVRQTMSPQLQPLTSIHHHSNLKFEYATNSSIIYVYMFTAIGLIVLMITSINFINLTTARASTRLKEIGIRKVVGAVKRQITFQLLLENILVVLLTSILALIIIYLLNPAFNQWTGKQIEIFSLLNPTRWAILIAGVSILGLLSGLYPAMSLSTHTFGNQNNLLKAPKTHAIRNVLVMGQFILSTLMIIGAIVIDRQLSLFQNTELGFDKMTNIILRVPDKEVSKKHETFRNELLQNSAIRNVSFTQTFPGERDKMAVLVYKAATEDETTIIPTFLTDLHFAKTLGIEIIEGRYFDDSRPEDRNNCLINRKAAELMGWADGAVGKEMHAIDLNLKGKVIGVTENFNFSSLHDDIEPLVIFPVLQFPQAFNVAIVNIEPGQIASVIPMIEETWKKFSVESPFDYALLDDNLKSLYLQDLTIGRVFRAFVILSVIISCIGLFGLTLYTLERRTKEISIRKVLGATTKGITLLISGSFLKLVFVANLIAIPLAYWLAKRWLNEFSYRINLGIDIFLSAILLSLLIALVTIILLTIQKALANPASQLKYE